MKEYNPKKIESKWQKKWEKSDLYKAKDFAKKPKKYILVEFPYPSGSGLHVGHARSYSALDAIARKKRMEGYNVLFPFGWDAFGLPTENYAIKTGIHPRQATDENIKTYKRQIKSLGLSVDWNREIDTTDPKYYKWTQWMFLKFFEKGLAYQAEMPINWCPSCKIGLANEEVVDGKCERCGAMTQKRQIRQWLLKITAYADKLLKGLEEVDYLEKIKAQQINWIGKSEGTEVKFSILGERFSQKENRSPAIVSVFTTRVDTIFGVTALVLAPEHQSIRNWELGIGNWDEVKKYIEQTKRKSDLERTSETKERTGIELKGIFAVNPANNEKVPVWISDYVLAHYGGGAVMMVPAHDKRDWDFSDAHNLPKKCVIYPRTVWGIDRDFDPLQKKKVFEEEERKIDLRFSEILAGNEAYTEYGRLLDSGEFTNLESEEAIAKITNWLEERGLGKKKVEYKLRDWIFSRQHYWGEPIPIIHCEKCGSTSSPQAVPVPEKDLPVKLPYVKNYQPTDTGESPLATIKEWVNVKCPKCKGPAKRETDTMPNWAGSSWYFLRYCDPKNNKAFADYKKLKYWTPVDLYNGGMEHTTLHLLYSRFWHRFLYDLKLVPTPEPYAQRRSHGMVLAEDGQKMSKSRGNVINPDEIIKIYGTDALRIYEMFMGPFDQAISWSQNGLVGCHRFLSRVCNLFNEKRKTAKSNKEIIPKLHQLTKKVSNDLEEMKFNTAIAAFMEFINFWQQPEQALSPKDAEIFLKLLSPFAPHLAEELWQGLGHKKSIFLEKWPKYDPRLTREESFELVVQINGRVRDAISAPIDISEEDAKKLALNSEKVQKWFEGKPIKKVIFVKNRLINLII
ncbi:MAG: leucine--tRNA ligase [Candidatus Portnoybacteria bacterium CG09_land_8_20_14_0_10_44_13]|uniref:Leucine--tRNA ligase n=2 Tax=Candidatus Portnoyibacteriota TaxID=1817913 RepID=A0A2H0WWM8_9BACT|nr:MAG: leucine--tRNA ligase [Candidatus Portnoybacteria bacterium CG09_land_8_20_14_0_10_44_13]PJA62881.1 MAG: leucine--tRNA ligase [Candidatus Portnoybacteria bacterium CG_4_9_14_3_um_filter_44_9]